MWEQFEDFADQVVERFGRGEIRVLFGRSAVGGWVCADFPFGSVRQRSAGFDMFGGRKRERIPARRRGLGNPLFGGVLLCSVGFGTVGERLVGVEVGRGDLSLFKLGDFFRCGRVRAIGLEESVAVAVDGDSGLEDVTRAFDLAGAEGRERAQQQAQLADVGQAAVVMRVVEIGELEQMGDDLVGGEFGDEIGAEQLIIAQVTVDGGHRAVHALADLAVGEALLSKHVGLEHEGSLGGVRIVGERHVIS